MRIQLELPEDGVRQLKDLMAEAGIATYKELFSYALTLLKWGVREARDGRIIGSLDEKRGMYKELAMPVFDTVARRHNARATEPQEAATSTGSGA